MSTKPAFRPYPDAEDLAAADLATYGEPDFTAFGNLVEDES